MKKIGLILVIVIGIFSFCFLNFKIKDDTYTEYLRIHIRADSNLEVDQNVKYLVKDKIVEFLTPLVSSVSCKDELIDVLNNNKENIKYVSDSVLQNEGFSYTTNVKINNEYFPTRDYNGFVLEKGYYDALIIELGSAKGNNWWCVLYPPLCFVNKNSSNVQDIYYQSKIIEIINKFFS